MWSTTFDLLTAALLFSIGWTAYKSGIFFNALYVLVLVMVPVRIAVVLWRLFRGGREYRLWQEPWAGELRAQRWQVLNHWVFWLLAGLTLEVGIVPAQFTSIEYSTIHALIWMAIIVLLLLALQPGTRVHAATNVVVAIGSIFMATEMARIFRSPKSEGVVLSAPFRGEWLVVNGGPSSLINGHYNSSNQREALDIERLVNLQERTGDGHDLASYPSWSETLYAPADGTVSSLISNLEDNAIGETDVGHPAGNHIVIDIGSGRFVMMAHLQKDSLLVARGDTVHTGQPIARCGNSGNTSGPHLHIQVQDQPAFSASAMKTFPILFRDVTCIRSQHPRTAPPFFVRRNDRIVTESAAKPAQE